MRELTGKFTRIMDAQRLIILVNLPVERLVGRSRSATEKTKIVYNSYPCPISDTIFKKEYIMKKLEVNRFNKLYELHLRSLKLQGKAQKTIEAYSRALRRVYDYFNCCPDKLKPEQLEKYFADLVDSHSWSTVKIDRSGLQFFWINIAEVIFVT